MTCQAEVGSLTKNSAAGAVGGSEPRWIEDAAKNQPAIERRIAHYRHRVPPCDTANAAPVLVQAVEGIAEGVWQRIRAAPAAMSGWA
jgi:hypothetical protein